MTIPYKTIGTVIGILLFSYLCTRLFVGATGIDNTVDLDNLTSEKLKIEKRMKVVIPFCEELDRLRPAREELEKQINAIINPSAFKVAEMRQTKSIHETPKSIHSVKNTAFASAPTKTADGLVESINNYWKGSILEGKGQLLVDECKRSKVPDICVKVIAAQTQIETSFGTTGTGRPHLKNLTGIRDKINGRWVWRDYEKYNESIVDTVKSFIDGNHEDYYNNGFENGICRHLKRWGTNHCAEVKEIVKSLSD